MLTSNRPFHLLLCAILSAIAAITTGCVVGDDPMGDGPDAIGAPDEPDTQGLARPGSADPCGVDAMSAAAFYQQFAYRDRGGLIPYRRGVTASFGTRLPNGDAAYLELNLLANGRVIATYDERRGSASQFESLNKTVIVTRATIDASTRKLTIPGVGTGVPITKVYNGSCVPSIAFSYAQDIRSSGLAGKVVMVDAVWSSMYVIDPDNLGAVPSADARAWFEEDVAAGVIRVVRM